MARDLFEAVDHRNTLGARRWYTVPLSIAVHTAIIAAVVVMPLLATGGLPQVPSVIAFVATAPPPAPPPPPPPPATTTITPARTATTTNPHVPPLEAPAEIRPETGIDAQPAHGEPGGVQGGVPGGLAGSAIVGGLPDAPAPPLPPARPLRVGGQIEAPVKMRDVRPVYPALAQAARVEGIVIIEATIGAHGRVVDATVLRSVPLLDDAALAAVRQWEFTPTLLNGVPVPVIMTVTVQFRLQ